MKRLAPAGAKVRLTGGYTQSPRDRYGRLLAYADTATVQLTNRSGWAK